MACLNGGPYFLLLSHINNNTKIINVWNYFAILHSYCNMHTYCSLQPEKETKLKPVRAKLVHSEMLNSSSFFSHCPPQIIDARLVLLLTQWANRLIKYHPKPTCLSLKTSPSSDSAPKIGLHEKKPPCSQIHYWQNTHYLPTWNGVKHPRCRVCDGGSWEKVINFMWKHGNFILTIHSVMAKFRYPLIKDVFWFDLWCIQLKKGKKRITHGKEQLLIKLRPLPKSAFSVGT